MSRYRCHGITNSGTRCKARCDNKGFCRHHPSTGGKVTKTGFAKIMGVGKSQVSNWLNDGTISECEDGFIEWEKARDSVNVSRDPRCAIQRQGEPMDIAGVSAGTAAEDADEIRHRTKVAQMQREEERAKIERLSRLEEEGRLVDIDEVRADAREAAERLKAALLAIPDRVSPMVMGLENVRSVHQIITEEITAALQDLGSEFADQ